MVIRFKTGVDIFPVITTTSPRSNAKKTNVLTPMHPKRPTNPRKRLVPAVSMFFFFIYILFYTDTFCLFAVPIEVLLTFVANLRDVRVSLRWACMGETITNMRHLLLPPREY